MKVPCKPIVMSSCSTNNSDDNQESPTAAAAMSRYNRKPSKIMCFAVQPQISKDSVKKLFLNDESINKYMDLIIERSPGTVYVFDTFFYFALSRKGYLHVSRWTKQIDIFTKSKLFIPVYVEEKYHWCLACIDFQAKTISYYDSLGDRNLKCLKLLLKYLILEHLDKKKEPFNTGGWALNNIKNCPRQKNLWDCGVFVCVFAEYLARDAKLDFCQDDMPKFRVQLFNEIKNNKLINQF